MIQRGSLVTTAFSDLRNLERVVIRSGQFAIVTTRPTWTIWAWAHSPTFYSRSTYRPMQYEIDEGRYCLLDASNVPDRYLAAIKNLYLHRDVEHMSDYELIGPYMRNTVSILAGGQLLEGYPVGWLRMKHD